METYEAIKSEFQKTIAKPKMPKISKQYVVCMCSLMRSRGRLDVNNCVTYRDVIEHEGHLEFDEYGRLLCEMCSCNCEAVFPSNRWSQFCAQCRRDKEEAVRKAAKDQQPSKL